ncbi:aminotransferase class IV family protein [Kitasatospora sp. NPDC058965]|uniref:aminotransferase class IV family protein n=1 Tax=Kitasatospora sp. NPDC058965 TaxID=3346682 RepID=UPI00369733F4
MAELNGKPISPDDLQTLALTNYGHFTSMRVEDGRVRGLDLHFARLQRDCRAVFGVDLDLEAVREFARRAVPSRGVCIARLTVFDPAMDLGHVGDDAHPQVLVTTRPAGSLSLPAMRVQSVAYSRDMPQVKSVGIFGSLRHRRAAQQAGFDDALFTDASSVISEGGTWNIGFIRDDQVIWPDAEFLLGTTMELLRRLHLSRTATVHLADLADYDAAFATNVGIGVRAIHGVDELTLPADHPAIDRLRRAYTELQGDLL